MNVFQRQFKKFKSESWLLVQFYTVIMESIVTSSITVWYGNTDEHTKKTLERIIINSAKIIVCELHPSPFCTGNGPNEEVRLLKTTLNLHVISFNFSLLENVTDH